MKLREQILKEHTKANCLRIVKWVGEDQKRFDELFTLFLSDEYRVIQRAAWPVSYCVIDHSKLINKHFKKLVENLKKPNLHTAVKRNSIRLLQDIAIPAKYEGDIMNICFNYIAEPTEAAAVKAFSIRVIENLSKKYPEILQELKTIIEDRWDYETPAFKSRARKIFAKR
ncbi:MAG: hypothetical protein HY252_12295 [Sphingobacteriales bacterium]|nr:hypothetical protein [Sphingobacteriales bacterium]